MIRLISSMVAALLTATLVSCGTRDRDVLPAAVDEASSLVIKNAAAKLCATQRLAAGGDTESARTLFFDQVHDPLHTLAAEVEEKDRRAAATLLQAKQQVEAQFQAETDTTVLASHVGRLIDAMHKAMAVLSIAATTCPGA